ncbi:hypothetical protein [Saccharothrix variisporea]|uniref:hypothetical protein n=1 Tax=Saccharothrix variisporea TaxID=543527 RepID=UPI0011C36C00|nr:hypothetical protein [Saccharothrix variisporea]
MATLTAVVMVDLLVLCVGQSPWNCPLRLPPQHRCKKDLTGGVPRIELADLFIRREHTDSLQNEDCRER